MIDGRAAKEGEQMITPSCRIDASRATEEVTTSTLSKRMAVKVVDVAVGRSEAREARNVDVVRRSIKSTATPSKRLSRCRRCEEVQAERKERKEELQAAVRRRKISTCQSLLIKTNKKAVDTWAPADTCRPSRKEVRVEVGKRVKWTGSPIAETQPRTRTLSRLENRRGG